MKDIIGERLFTFMKHEIQNYVTISSKLMSRPNQGVSRLF